MKHRIELLTNIGLATSLVLSGTACGGSSRKAEQLRCTGLEFAAPKGGPGAIEIYVFPAFSKKIGAVPTASISGIVESGNDTGETVSQSPDAPHGKFTFTWDPTSKAIQTSVVKATTEVNDQMFTCGPTTLHFNPETYKISPGVPNSLLK